jgi:hypothetical protein
MPKNQKLRQKINLITLFFVLGLLPPVILIFNKNFWWMGMPALFVYIFLLWTFYIIITAILAQKTDN